MIDTHCHLIDPQFKKDLPEVIQRAQATGVHTIINAGYDVKTSKDAVDMSEQYKSVLPAAGIHPNEAAHESIQEFGAIEEIVGSKRVIAIGETGLDYYRNKSPQDAQKELFRKHIVLARKYSLPLLIHTRNSIEDTVKILDEKEYFYGVFHCYSGTIEQARMIVDRGLYLGFGGVLTFSKRTRTVLHSIPLDKIVLETDAPFLSPAGHRGQRNEPSYIIETLNIAAQVLDIKPEKCEQLLDSNAAKLFSLSARE